MNINDQLNKMNHMLELNLLNGQLASFEKHGLDLTITLNSSKQLTITGYFAKENIDYAAGNT